ncbi:MAG TPA: SgcJ/EcaC family oxidoreductase [Rubrobacter sp.]|nr:SgcJ/EcaC family oxidoreductase [Rubrobacter sp.]
MTIRSNHQETTGNPADGRAIRELFERLLEDWARGDGEAYGSRFTGDADYVAFDGSHTRGREEISSSHQQLFDKFLKGSRLTGRIESIKFPTPDVALVHATGGTIVRGRTEPSPERHSVQTLVAVREGDGWRFAAFHNTRVRPIGGGLRGFLIWAVTDRLWRIFGPREDA